ncbi:MAG TPA: precorrin-3B synthase [Blastocatellia bacterium]|nr:precorrin-3B synthase [Blastocatellia bacterium]
MAIPKIEIIKQRKDGLDVLPDIMRAASLGLETLDPDDAELLKWYGIYTQRPAADGYFMVRIRIPNGLLTSEQVRTIAELSDLYGRGLSDITVRQDIQLHWVRIEDIPDIFERLSNVGLTTQQACGDTVRNIIGCPVAGIDADEICDTSPIVADLTKLFLGNRAVTNLPRKFKISVSGCRIHCTQPEIQDIGIYAVNQPDGLNAFRIRVGGGLATAPRFSTDMGIVAQAEELNEICSAIISVFHDHGSRENRKKARLKVVIENWGIEKFRNEVEKRLGRQLTRAADPEPLYSGSRSHVGIHRQKSSNRYYVGLAVVAGRLLPGQLSRLAELANRYGDGRLRTTIDQSLLLVGIEEKDLSPLTRELKITGFEVKPSSLRRNIIACTGIQFCKLALAETKSRAATIVEELEQRIVLPEDVRISVTGCPNSCAQYDICDIGLEGGQVTINGEKHEAFSFLIGGGLGEMERFGRRLPGRVLSDDVAPAIEKLINWYYCDRRPSESFRAFCWRHSVEEINDIVKSFAKADAVAV